MKYLSRKSCIAKMRWKLDNTGFPRFQMMFILALTGGVGFVSSWGMNQAGMHEMWLRYPISLMLAYTSFFGFLWLWLRTNTEDYIPDGIDPSLFPTPSGNGQPVMTGQGGTFGGGGASGSHDLPETVFVTSDAFGGDGFTSDISEAAGDLGSADELAIPLVLVLIAAAVAFSSLYVVWVAPSFFAELALDGALSMAVYQRLRAHDRRHWIETAFSRTIIPFLITFFLLAGAGIYMESTAPKASTLTEFIQSKHLKSAP